MPAIVTDDGVTSHAEETGAGEPLLFIHEFAGDHRSWEPQVRFFSPAYRCVSRRVGKSTFSRTALGSLSGKGLSPPVGKSCAGERRRSLPQS
jgi:pimeloyl-ACP methyl ester carboxylesterase